MKDESLQVIKQLAVKLTIEKKDDMIYFTHHSTLKIKDKEYEHARVYIPEEILDVVVDHEGDNAVKAVESMLQLVEA